MPVERLGHGRPIRRVPLLDQRCRADDDARNAEAALHTALEHERLADRSAHVVRQSFDGHHVASTRLFRLAQTRQRRMAVDHHEAAATTPFRRAAVLRRHHADLLAQHVEQVHAGLVRRFDRGAV
jgi:hypothetical protein